MSLHANVYQVDELLVGRRVELAFDPFDLAEIEVRYRGRSFGPAVGFRIGRHTHPKARPEHPGTEPEPTGIDYLRLIDTSHTERLAARINYAALLDSTSTDTSGATAVPPTLDPPPVDPAPIDGTDDDADDADAGART